MEKTDKHKENGNSGSKDCSLEPQLLDDFTYLDEDYDQTIEESIVFIQGSLIAVKFFIFDVSKNRNEMFTGRLYLPGVLQALRELGFFKRQRADGTFLFIREKKNIICEVEPSKMKEAFYDKHLRNPHGPLIFIIKDAMVVLSAEAQQQAYLKQANQVFNAKFLEHLETHEKPVIEDSKHASHFFFKNKIAIASSTGIKTMEYADLQNICVWEEHLIDHEFEYTDDFQEGHYQKFIRNLSRNQAGRKDAFYSGIGYLLNNFNSPSKSQAIICYDEVPSETGDPNGGTGKGVFCKAVKQLRNTFKLDGKNIRRDDKFKFQGLTDRTQLFWIDDAADNFPFEMLHSAITDGFTIERKYQHQFYIPAEKSPKVVLCSNTILAQGGTTNRRRQFILEFSDYYSSKIVRGTEEPILDEHGGLFFDNESWDEDEWNKFFSFMVWCSQFYHFNGLMPYTQMGQERSRLIQMTSPAFNEWLAQRDLKVGEEYENSALYDEYCEFAELDTSFFKQRKFTGWIRIYAENMGWETKVRPSNGRRFMRFEARQSGSA